MGYDSSSIERAIAHNCLSQTVQVYYRQYLLGKLPVESLSSVYFYYCRTAVAIYYCSYSIVEKQQPTPSYEYICYYICLISWQQCRMPGSMQLLLAHIYIFYRPLAASGLRYHRLLRITLYQYQHVCVLFSYVPFHLWKDKSKSFSR